MNDVLEMIREERKRQIGKGYDAKHDDGHNRSEIAAVASALAHPNAYSVPISTSETTILDHILLRHPDRIEQLVIAAAMLVAEIERLQRVAERERRMKA